MKIYVPELNEVINLDHVVMAVFEPSVPMYKHPDGHFWRGKYNDEGEEVGEPVNVPELTLEGKMYHPEYSSTITKFYGATAEAVWQVLKNDAYMIA